MEDLETYRQATVTVFKGGTGARLALRDPKVAALKVIKEQEKPADWLAERLQTEFLGDTGVFKLTLVGVSPEEQALILNAIVKEYVRDYEQFLPKRWTEAVEHNKSWLASCRASLKNSEAMLNEGELTRLPPQIDRGEYVKAIKMEIDDRKAAVKKMEKALEESEKMLKALPLVRVIEWADAPPSK